MDSGESHPDLDSQLFTAALGINSDITNWALCPGLTNDTCVSSGEQSYSAGE